MEQARAGLDFDAGFVEANNGLLEQFPGGDHVVGGGGHSAKAAQGSSLTEPVSEADEDLAGLGEDVGRRREVGQPVGQVAPRGSGLQLSIRRAGQLRR